MVTTQYTDEKDRAQAQAAMQLESIVAMVDRLEHARKCTMKNCAAGSVDGDGFADAKEYHDAEAAREFLIESPLSVEVRTDWHAGGCSQCREADALQTPAVLGRSGSADCRHVGRL
jgi:hypothetical protein